jgi:hypothetical protein
VIQSRENIGDFPTSLKNFSSDRPSQFRFGCV